MNDLAKEYNEAQGSMTKIGNFRDSMDYFCIYSLLRRGYPDDAIAKYFTSRGYGDSESVSLVAKCKSIMSALSIIEAMEDKASG